MIRPRHVPTALALLACAFLAVPWSAGATPLRQNRSAQNSPGQNSSAQDGGRREGGQGRERHEEGDETPLSRAMEQMKGATRRLERALQSDDAATALALVADFQAGVVAAKSETPSKAATLPEDEREAFAGEFRVTMVKLLRVTCDLEDALLDSRFEDARKIYENDLRAMQKPSHERFRTDDD